MRTKKLYEVRVYQGMAQIGRRTQKLRSYQRVRRLVKGLKARGLDAQAWPVSVAA